MVVNTEASDWLSVTSWVPQGPGLGPRLFIIYINDQETRLTGRISKFAVDSKLANSPVKD